MTNAEPTTASPDQRKLALTRAVQHEVAKGGRVESQTDYNAIIRFGKKTNHVLHLLLGVLTLTLWWWTVWPAVAIYNAARRRTISLDVDEYGHILRQTL